LRNAAKIFGVLLAVFFIWNVFVYFTGRHSITYVTRGSISDAISCEGQIIKEEVLVQAPSDGVLQPYLSDCEKTGKGNSVAAILSGETNEGARKELTTLKSRISSLEDMIRNKNFEEDVVAIDSEVSGIISKIISYGAGGRTTKVQEYKENIIKQLDRRNAVVNSNSSELLNDLKSKQKTLEANLGNLINEVHAPVSGVFSASLDGLEGKYNKENIEKLTKEDLEIIKNTKPSTIGKVSKGDNVCKIMDNFEWFIAAYLTKNNIGEMEEGDKVTIAFRDADRETASARVYKIVEQKDGNYIVSFKLSSDIGGIISRRSVSIDIIKKTYEGIKIPTGALVFKDDKPGVYVVNGNSRVFKQIEVVFHNDSFVIAKENSQFERPLLLYDNVEVNGDGKSDDIK